MSSYRVEPSLEYTTVYDMEAVQQHESKERKERKERKEQKHIRKLEQQFVTIFESLGVLLSKAESRRPILPSISA
jgi:hypothetical protein